MDKDGDLVGVHDQKPTKARVPGTVRYFGRRRDAENYAHVIREDRHGPFKIGEITQGPILAFDGGEEEL